jgi:pimeloyl-ACP methyl ester carboxylesterase
VTSGSGVEEPTEHRLRANGVELAWFEWGRERRGDGPTLLLAHATGFHARCWDPVVRRLGDRHVIALDQRSHGRSEKTEIRHWDVFGRDLAAVVDALELEGLVGVGHSMGGHAMVDAAALRPEAFRRLMLIDPVIASPDQYGEGGWTISNLAGMQHPTAKRKRRFASPEAMIERFRDRVPYAVFHPEALEAYCRFGLLPTAHDDEWKLACPPEIEASIYLTSRTNRDIHDSVRRVDVPVLLLRAKRPAELRDPMDFSSSPTWPGLVGELRRGREIHFADHTHFLPMELPDRIAELILGEVAAAS